MWRPRHFYLRVLCFSEGSRTPRPHGPPPRCYPGITIAERDRDSWDRSHHCQGLWALSPRCFLVLRFNRICLIGQNVRSGVYPPLTSCPCFSYCTGVVLTAITSSRCSSLSPALSRVPCLMTRHLRGRQYRPLSATACGLLVVAEARLMPCHLRRPGETGLVVIGGTSDSATRHPVTERSEVEVPRSDIVPTGKVPAGAALGDGRRPAVGCPAGKNLSWEII